MHLSRTRKAFSQWNILTFHTSDWFDEIIRCYVRSEVAKREKTIEKVTSSSTSSIKVALRVSGKSRRLQSIEWAFTFTWPVVLLASSSRYRELIGTLAAWVSAATKTNTLGHKWIHLQKSAELTLDPCNATMLLLSHLLADRCLDQRLAWACKTGKRLVKTWAALDTMDLIFLGGQGLDWVWQAGWLQSCRFADKTQGGRDYWLRQAVQRSSTMTTIDQESTRLS